MYGTVIIAYKIAAMPAGNSGTIEIVDWTDSLLAFIFSILIVRSF
jgi:hypothetical protein